MKPDFPTPTKIELWETPEGAISISQHGRRELTIYIANSGLIQIKITSGEPDGSDARKYYQIIEFGAYIAEHLSARLKRLAGKCEHP